MAEEQYGLSEAGFKLKRLRAILDDVKQKMLLVEDPKTGEKLQIDFEENDPFIQFINLVCDQLATIWELLNAAYDQFDPLKATGPMLSALVQLNGITRKRGQSSTVMVRFYGERGFVVPIGTRVCDEEQTVIWKVVGNDNDPSDVAARTIDISDGSTFYCLVECDSQNNGAYEAEAGQITRLVDTLTGVTSVVNPAAATPGEADESDIALRRRREKATETPSQGLAESIYCAIAGLEGVDYCKVFTNRTMATDGRGIPAKSIAVVAQVDDKTDTTLKQAIAKKIFLTSGLGEEYYNLDDHPELVAEGDICQMVEFTDSFNQITKIKFIYPQEVPIFIKLGVTDMEGSQKPGNYQDQIRNNIVQFAKYGVQGIGLVRQQNIFDDFGFPPSENVDISRLYTPINAVPGIKVTSLQIGTSLDSLQNMDIDIDWWQVAKFIADAEHIDIQYSETQYQ